MRNLFFLSLLFGGSMMAAAQTSTASPKVVSAEMLKAKVQKFEMPKTFNPLSLQRQFDQNLLQELAKKSKSGGTPVENNRLQVAKARTGKQLNRVGEAVDTVDYFTVAQSYYTDRSFVKDGGDVLPYKIGVAIDGTKVTFTNFFNLYDPTSWSPAHDYPISGTYDAAKKTITIPTKSSFAEATVCGDFWGTYPAVLMCGTVDETGKLAPDNELVFTVEGDFDRITTDQAVCAFMYSPDGSQSYGTQEAFKRIYIQKPSAGAKLVTMATKVDLGASFPNYPISKTFAVANLGNDATDFVIETESDDDAFSVSPVSGSLEGQSVQKFIVGFEGTAKGDYEGISTIEWDGEDAEPIMVQLTGSVTPYPDYSGAVKGGDLTLTTDIDYPFVVDTLDNGTIVAASDTKGYGGASSKLYVKFTVPEGKLGTFSWKGVSNNSNYYYYNAGGVFIDDNGTAYSAFTDANEDMSDKVEFAPGEHVVRFQYDGYYYTGDPNNRLYVYDLNLELAELADDAAELKTPAVDLGQFIVEDDAPATGTGEISLVNKGKNPLKVNKITIDGDQVFTVASGNSGVATMETLTLPVELSATEAGDYAATAYIETNAGTYNVALKALVRNMPDYQSIVAEGDFTFTTDASHPFLVENGAAYNSTAKVTDTEYNTASFTASFTVPEGKIGILSWDGDLDAMEPTEAGNWYTTDYGTIEIGHPLNTGSMSFCGRNTDAGSNATFASDEFWASYLQCIPGSHYIKFMYTQNGDSKYDGEDRMSIRNLKLTIMDFNDHNAELASDEATFDSTFVGYNRYTTTTVTLNNLGSKALKVIDIPQAGAFYGIVPTDSAQFSKSLDVTLWFYPTAPGEYSDTLTIKTNAGDFKVACTGVAKSSEGYILVGDFEDDAYGWSTYDADKDGEGWNLGYNLFGGDFPEYCHSGKQCLGSASYSYYNGDITPNNYTFSPLIEVPEDGAELSWYAAEQSKRRAGDHYSVYIATQEEVADPDKLADLTEVFSETLDSTKVDTWSFNHIDLTPYAGKTIVAVFRHHDCTGNWLVKLDDVFVWTKEAWNNATSGIDHATATGAANGKQVVRQETYDLTGKLITAPTTGISIVRTVYADGTCTTTKVMRK